MPQRWVSAGQWLKEGGAQGRCRYLTPNGLRTVKENINKEKCFCIVFMFLCFVFCCVVSSLSVVFPWVLGAFRSFRVMT